MSKFCGVCGTNIGDETWSGHSQTSSHLRNVEQKENSIELETENSWGDVYARDLLRVFAQFGPIIKLTMGSTTMPPTGTATLEYSDPKAVQKVLSQAYYRVRPEGAVLHNKKTGIMVRVARWLPEKQKIANRELEEREKELTDLKVKQLNQDMFSTIKLSNWAVEQIEQLSWMQEILQSDKAAAEDLRNEIQSTVQQYIPELQVHVVGSFGNGLSVRGSNLSLLLELGKPKPRKIKPKAPPLPAELMTRLDLQILDGYISLMSLKRNDNLPWVVYEILNRSPMSITTSNMRLVKNGESGSIVFRYLKLQITCEMYINTYRSTILPFTELTKLLVQLDPRVRPLFLVVRLWAQQLGFYPGVFSNKNLLLLLYFFLQNTKPPVLPSLDTLNHLCEEGQKDIVKGIDLSFCSDISLICQRALLARNHQTVAELIQGFFRFYSKYDLVNRVFCPRSGRSYNMLKWRNMKKAVPKLHTFEIFNRAFHIQDLFIQQVNTSSPVVKSNTKHLICTELLRAAELTQSQVDQGWNLLTFIPPNPVKERTKPKLSRQPSVVLPFYATTLPEGFLIYESYAEAERQWFQWTVELTMKVLEILRIEYHLEGDYGEEEFPPGKRRRTDSSPTEKPSDPTDFSTEYQTPWTPTQECRLTCVDTENLWQRRPLPKYSKPSDSVLELEEKLTTRQLQVEQGKDHKKSELRFSIKLKHVKTANEIQLEIYLEVIGMSMNFVQFREFFSSFANTVLNKTLSLHLAL